jgi:mannosyl-glycoprotein endo-beta-N-acetylglucosaminidase
MTLGLKFGVQRNLYSNLQMPLRGTGHSNLVGDEAPYFESLAELDAWAATPSKKLSGVLGFWPRRRIDGLDTDHRGKLLVNELISTLITQLS